MSTSSTAALDAAVTSLSSQPGVEGVLVADGSGLCLAHSGVLSSSGAGHVAALLDGAASLSDDGLGEHPTLALHTRTRNILLHHADGINTAVAKQNDFVAEWRAATAAAAAAAADAAAAAAAAEQPQEPAPAP